MWDRVKVTAVLLVTICSGGPAAATISVAAGEDLQAALNQARPGDTILLQAGATFVGNFLLPAKEGASYITLRSNAPDQDLPGAADRIAPEYRDKLPTIKSPNNLPSLRTAPAAGYWRILAVAFQGNGGGDILALGDGSRAQAALTDIPENLIVDRVLILGDPDQGQKRGIALNSGSTVIKNSYIADIKKIGQETQAIAGWNGTGPYLIENNFLQAAGVNLMFGGADPTIGNLVPSDIVIRRNHFTKPLEWRGSRWNVKNLLELKNARRVLIEGNILEYNWRAAQAGYAVVFTVRNAEGRAPWSTLESITFQNNIVQHVAAGVVILGFDDLAPSRQARGILIRNNLFDDVDHRLWGGNGVFLQVSGPPADVVVDHNTIFQTGNLVTVYGGSRDAWEQVVGFRFTNNIARHNTYGIFGNAVGVGNPAIAAYFPGAEIAANVMAGGQASRYPGGNFFPPADALSANFVNPGTGNYRLADWSSFRTAGTDGTDLGVNFAELTRALTSRTRVDRDREERTRRRM